MADARSYRGCGRWALRWSTSNSIFIKLILAMLIKFGVLILQSTLTFILSLHSTSCQRGNPLYFFCKRHMAKSKFYFMQRNQEEKPEGSRPCEGRMLDHGCNNFERSRERKKISGKVDPLVACCLLVLQVGSLSLLWFLREEKRCAKNIVGGLDSKTKQFLVLKAVEQ